MSAEHGLDPWDRITSQESKPRLVCLPDNLETGLKLIRDFRQVPDHSLTRWRLEIPSDGREEEFTLTWEYGSLAPDRLLWLQRLEDERPAGCPIDMKTTQQLNGLSGKLEFEIIYGRQQTRNFPLQSGWDAIDSQLLSMLTLGELLSQSGHEDILPGVWFWNRNQFRPVATNQVLSPENSYLIFFKAKTSALTITGLPPDGCVLLQPGWNSFSIPASGLNPMFPFPVMQTSNQGGQQVFTIVPPGEELLPRQTYWLFNNSPNPFKVQMK